MKKIFLISIKSTILLLTFSVISKAQTDSEAPAIVWSSSRETATYNVLAKEPNGYSFRKGRSTRRNEIEIRPGRNGNYIEVKHLRGNEWIAISVPTMTNESIDVLSQLSLVEAISKTSNCDLVQTINSWRKSTPNASVYYNSKLIGNIGADGRHSYTSKGVCRNHRVNLLVSLKNCKDHRESYIPVDNPHPYNGVADLECTKSD